VTGGANAGQKQTISDFDASTGLVTFDSGFTAVFGVGDTFTITGLDEDDFNGFDVQKRYISNNTKLEDMNNGKGVHLGQFQVTTRDSKLFTVSITNASTVDDVISQFNLTAIASGSDARLTVNDNGNGLIVTSPTGSGSLVVKDIDGGTSASDLNIDGNTTSTTIDGSFEYTVNITSTDTLNDVRNSIEALGLDLSVSVLNDGSQSAPYRLNIVSNISGSQGEVIMDDFDNSFNFTPTTKAQDAAIVMGGISGGSTPFLISDQDNTITDVIPGLTLQLQDVSSSAVTITITRNTDAIVESMKEFSDQFNEAVSEIQDLIKFDTDTNEAAILQGNSAVRQIERDLFAMITKTLDDVSAPYNRFSSVGLTINSDGSGVDFEESDFRAAIESNFDEVRRLLDLGGNIQDTTALSELRGGEGIRTVTGSNDLEVTQSDGTVFNVNLDSANTIVEVINAINFATGNSGSVVASLKTDGTGIQIVDSSGGSGSFKILNYGTSSAALDLGIQKTGQTSGSNFLIEGFDIRDRGLMAVANADAGNIVDEGGKISRQDDVFDEKIEDLNEQIERIEARVASEEARLFQQFADLETVLADLQAQSSFISAQLGSLNQGG
jgi:flagellar hook-associated protein 2